MADEIQHFDDTGLALYAKPLPLDTISWTGDVEALTEIAGCDGYYAADIGSPADAYAVFLQAGGSPAATDTAIATITRVAQADVLRISGDETAADNLEAAADGTGYNLGGGDIVVANVTGSIGSLAAQAKADVNAEVDQAITDAQLATAAQASAIETDTQDVQAQIGAAGAGLTALGDARLARLDAAVSSRAVAGDAMTLTAGERTSVAAAVWAATTRTLSGFGTLIADLWAHATRRLSDRTTGDGSVIAAAGADADTLKSVSDQIDAVAAGVATVLARTAAGVTIAVGSHIATDGVTLELVQGESYLAAINNRLEIDVTDGRLPATAQSDGTVPVLRIVPVGREAAALTITGVMVSHDPEIGAATVGFEVTQAQTAGLSPGVNNVWELDFMVAGNAAHALTSVVEAPCRVRRQIA
jgi:hypothetical protein